MVREEETKRSRTKETCKPTHPRRKMKQFNSLLADNNLYVYGEPRKAVGNGRE